MSSRSPGPLHLFAGVKDLQRQDREPVDHQPRGLGMQWSFGFRQIPLLRKVSRAAPDRSVRKDRCATGLVSSMRRFTRRQVGIGSHRGVLASSSVCHSSKFSEVLPGTTSDSTSILRRAATFRLRPDASATSVHHATRQFSSSKASASSSRLFECIVSVGKCSKGTRSTVPLPVYGRTILTWTLMVPDSRRYTVVASLISEAGEPLCQRTLNAVPVHSQLRKGPGFPAACSLRSRR